MMHKFKLILICLVGILPSACALLPDNPVGQSPDKRSSANPTHNQRAAPAGLIALDFVNALVQIPSLSPVTTTINVLSTDRNDEFTQSMQAALQTAGYGIRWVEDYHGEHLLQYRHEREAGDIRAHRDLFEVAVGAVELRRTYAIGNDNRISPLTPLYVRGTDASHIVLNDAAFGTLPVRANGAAAAGSGGPAASVAPVPLRPVDTPSGSITSSPLSGLTSTVSGQPTIADAANPLNPAVSRVPPLSLPLVALPRVENVFELGGSNFEDLLAGHNVVQDQSLVFPDDSLRLGPSNKLLVEQIATQFNPDTDMFSLLGCSVGPTALAGGNAALALGRASRVREALLFAGIPAERILDEGCWASDSSDKRLLKRGVVITLNRKPLIN